MRRADDAHIEHLLGGGTDRTHRALLDRAQQLALHRQRQLADLVEKERAAAGGLEEALAVLAGAGEGALAVAEELRLEQRLGNRAAVDRDEGLGGTVADLMDRAGHQLLAGAGLAVHQHRRHAARHLGHQLAHLAHHRRAARQALQRSDRRCRHGGGHRRHGGTRRRRHPPQRGGHDAAELAQVDRLGQIVEGTGLERQHRVLGRAVGGDDQRLLGPAGLLEPAQQLQPVAVGQPHVGDDRIEAGGLQQRPGLLDAGRRLDVVALAQQRQLVEGAQIGLVVDDQQARRGSNWGRIHEAAAGSVVTPEASATRGMVTTKTLRWRAPGPRGRNSIAAR